MAQVIIIIWETKYQILIMPTDFAPYIHNFCFYFDLQQLIVNQDVADMT